MAFADTIYELGYALQYALSAHCIFQPMRKAIHKKELVPYELICVLYFAPGGGNLGATPPPSKPPAILYGSCLIIFGLYIAIFRTDYLVAIGLSTSFGMTIRTLRDHEIDSVAGVRELRMCISWLFAIGNLCFLVFYYICQYDSTGVVKPAWTEWLG